MQLLRIPGRRRRRRLILLWSGLPIAVIALSIYSMSMPGRPYSGPFLPLSKEEELLSHRLAGHVRQLAGEIGERNIWNRVALERSAAYIEEFWEGLGWEVRPQEFEAEGAKVSNLEIEFPGSSRPEEIVVVGAHYDTVIGSPGANDNASGVAALLEISRRFATQQSGRTLRFVAFVNEEPPFFQTGLMGSRVYAARSRSLGERISAMVSLETIGYYSEQEGSQRYPFPLAVFYPGTANFIAFVGNTSSRGLVREAISSFRGHTRFPSQGAAVPGWISGIGWSDHGSFWQEGYPAVMVTDTALYRYEHYHTPEDTPDKIDYARLARVVSGIIRVVVDLAGPDGRA